MFVDIHKNKPCPFCQLGALCVASFSCIFLRAAKIISSRRRCSIFWRSALSVCHPGDGAGSSFSLPLSLILLCRLYRVMRSTSGFLGVELVLVVVADVVVNVIGGWKLGGAYIR
jgi:hypothetical protein